jgi:hypothetical protein
MTILPSLWLVLAPRDKAHGRLAAETAFWFLAFAIAPSSKQDFDSTLVAQTLHTCSGNIHKLEDCWKNQIAGTREQMIWRARFTICVSSHEVDTNYYALQRQANHDELYIRLYLGKLNTPHVLAHVHIQFQCRLKTNK